jgi:TonB family protein
MSHRYTISVGLAFLAIASLSHSQTATSPGKNCVPPKVKSNPPPGRPAGHIANNEETAVVNILVDEKGRVSDPQLTRSSGSADYDADSLRTILDWKFKPSTCDGEPVPIRIAVEIRSMVP